MHIVCGGVNVCKLLMSIKLDEEQKRLGGQVWADTGETQGPDSWLPEEPGGPSYRRTSEVQGSATGRV